MSSIIFEGNTYTFGATVSANPGTGTTSYVFGGLSSGWTYGFIIWAFNGVGPSSIVGPITKVTLSEILTEQREIIGAFAAGWGDNSLNIQSLRFYTGNTLNLFYDSEYFTSDQWNFGPAIKTEYSELMPMGDTGWVFSYPPGTYLFPQIQQPLLEGGSTYIASWYMHTGSSASGFFFGIYGTEIGGADTIPVRQILPQIGTGTTSSSQLSLLGPTGSQTGWIRYAVEIFVSGNSRKFTLPFRIGTSFNSSYIIGAPQLEKVIN